MSNPLEETAVVLAGSGFVAKENGNFQPGEYKRLCNMELNNSGVLVNRRNVNSVFGESQHLGHPAMENLQGFLGNMGQFTLVYGNDIQWIVGSSTFMEIWSDLDQSPSDTGSFSIMVGFFRYNNQNYWIVLEFDTGTSIALALYYDNEIPVPDLPETYVAGYESNLTREVIISFAAGTNDFYDFQFRNFFLYKDRLWIATSVGLYFSAATDPTNFIAPAGGFFKYPDNVVNWALAIKDSVYVLCENAVYALTYSTDPNLDSTQRPLSTTVGGEMGCVHLDIPYFINNLGIFSIDNNNVAKVLDSRFDYGQDIYKNRLFSFENYLIVNKYSNVNYDNNYAEPNRADSRRNVFPNGESADSSSSQILTGWAGSVSPAKTRTNKVPNPSFEVNPNSNGSWFNTTFNPSTMSVSTAQKVFGTQSCTITRTETAGFKPIGIHSFWMNVVEATEYAASAYVRPNKDCNVRISIFWQGPDLVDLGVSLQGYACTGGQWSRISKKAYPPNGAVTATIQILFGNIDGNAPQYIDGALFEVNKSASLLDYFDGSMVDTTLDDYIWSGTVNNSASIVTYKTASVDAMAAVSGVLQLKGTLNQNPALKYLANFNEYYVKALYSLNPVTQWVPNTEYTLAFEYASTIETDARMQVRVDFKDSGGLALGSVIRTITNPVGSVDNFQDILTTFVPPSSTDSIVLTLQITFGVENNTVADTTYQFRFNRFIIEKSNSYGGFFNGASTDMDSVSYGWTGTAFNSESLASLDTHGYLHHNGSNFNPFQKGNSLGYNTYFINTENGATHVLDFYDQCSGDMAHGVSGFIVDGITNPFKDDSGNYKWMFMTNKFVESSDSGVEYGGFVYYISSSEDTEVVDYVFDTDHILNLRSPKVDIEIDSFVPDGFEYRVKKFRSLMFQGIIPEDTSLDVGYDNTDYVQTVALGDDESVYSDPRRHYAHRVGLNQRGRSITLRLRYTLFGADLDMPVSDMEISDIRALWSPTAKTPSTKRIGS